MTAQALIATIVTMPTTRSGIAKLNGKWQALEMSNSKSPDGQRKRPGPPPGPPVVATTLRLPVELVERSKNTVAALTGMSLARLARDALNSEIARLEVKYHDGAPFPPRAEVQLKNGPPPVKPLPEVRLKDDLGPLVG